MPPIRLREGKSKKAKKTEEQAKTFGLDKVNAAGQKYYNQFKDDNLAKKLDMSGEVSAIFFFYFKY